jgi:hypothetical protein
LKNLLADLWINIGDVAASCCEDIEDAGMVVSVVAEEAEIESALGASPKRLDIILRLFLPFKVQEDRSMATPRFIAHPFSTISVFPLTVLPKEGDPLGVNS